MIQRSHGLWGVLLLLLLFLGTSSAQGGKMSLYGGGTVMPDQSITLEAYLRERPRETVALYRVANPEAILQVGGPRYFENSDNLDLTLLRTVSVKPILGRSYASVSIGTLPSGIYFAQLGQGDVASATLIVSTELGMVVKRDSGGLTTFTASLIDGSPQVSSVYLLSDDKTEEVRRSDTDGVTQFQSQLSEPVLAARSGNNWAFSRSYWQRWNVQKTLVYISTDQPIYRPGQQMSFKGIARSADGLVPLAGEEVEVIIDDADGTEVLRETLTTDAYGSFVGSYQIPNVPPLGFYGINSTILEETTYSSFSVEEFEKPEYRVDVTLQEQENSPDGVRIQGTSATFTIKSSYLFGGAVAGAEVRYSIMKQPYYRWTSTYRYGFEEEHGYAGMYGGEVLERSEGVLNVEGELEITIPLEPDEKDYQITLQAGVTDETRREISGTGKVIAFRSGIVLDVKTDSYAYEEGEDAVFSVQAEDIWGNPVSVPFELTLTRNTWRRGHGRVLGRPLVLNGTTDDDGQARVSHTFTRQGSYSIEVQAADVEGRATEAQSYVWVSGQGPWYWGYNSVSIRPDKTSYTLGETARIVVQSPIENAYALITFEGERLERHQVVPILGSVLTYEIEITPDMSPNVFVGVTLMGKGNIYYETTGFQVPVEGKELNVEITSDNDVYQPGETGTFDLRLSDVSGTGVKAQVALTLVDEALFLVYSNHSANITNFFYALKANSVGTEDSLSFYFGNAAAVDAMETAGSFEPMEDSVFAQPKEVALAEADLREDFRDSILWLPLLETDDQGLARVEVVFPDNLTEWRLTAQAITLEDQMGQNSYSVTTSLPVIARLAKPQYFIRGDEASVRVIGQSNLESDVEGKLLLETEGFVQRGAEPEEVTLTAGGRVTRDITLRATTTGIGSMTASALSTEFSDALKVPVPILPRGVRDTLAWAGQGSSTWDFAIPAQTDPSSIGGTLFVTPSLSAAVSPALAYLAGYPYGCTEQTMSRFLPSVLAAQVGERASLPGSIEENLDDMVLKGIKRLQDFQHYDGGWGFWKHDNSSPFISAYVVSGLLHAQEAGYHVRSWMLDNALRYLERVVNGEITPQEDYQVHGWEDGKAYAYYALALAGEPITEISVLQSDESLSLYGLALVTLALSYTEQTYLSNIYLDALLARVTETTNSAHFRPEAQRYYWNDDTIETTARALEALVRLRPTHPLVGKMVHWLLMQRQGARWVSTKDTAAVVMAALTLQEQTAQEGEQQLAVSINGSTLESFALTEEMLEVPLSGVELGDNQLKLEVSGSSEPVYISAQVAYVEEQQRIAREGDHFMITRSYERLTPVVDEEHGYIYERTPIQGQTAVGDYLLVTITLKPRESYRYVLVNEPLPAGYRVIENDLAFRIDNIIPRYGYDAYGWNYWFDGRDVRTQQIDFYFNYLAHEITFTYMLRAETPGVYTALPTQAFLMYEPDIRGLSTEARLKVKP